MGNSQLMVGQLWVATVTNDYWQNIYDHALVICQLCVCDVSVMCWHSACLRHAFSTLLKSLVVVLAVKPSITPYSHMRQTFQNDAFFIEFNYEKESKKCWSCISRFIYRVLTDALVVCH